MIVQVVTITSWKSFNDAFEEAVKVIPQTSSLWDVEVSRSADRGCELKLYFLKGLADADWLGTQKQRKSSTNQREHGS